jgi:hypothetical protein
MVRIQQGLAWFDQMQRRWLVPGPQSVCDGLTSALRGVARAMGLLASAPIAIFFLYASSEQWTELSWSSALGIPLLIALSIAAVSALIAWRSELVGGVLTIGSAIAVGVLVHQHSGPGLFPLVMLNILPYSLAGILLLVCDRHRRSRLFWQVVGVGVLVYLGSGNALLLFAVLNTSVYCLAGVLFIICHLRAHPRTARLQGRKQRQSAALEHQLSRLQ